MGEWARKIGVERAPRPIYNPAPMAEGIELKEDVSASPLYNDDIAPTPLERRTWGKWHIAALWIGMAVCIPTYMLGAGLMKAGMTWWQAVLTITLGNLVVLIPMALNAHAGTRYGIPFPVFLRAPFGVYGSNVPALLRAAVACGWFGIQTWIGGKALYLLAAVMAPSIAKAAPIGGLGINGWQLLFFLLFWAANVFFIVKGTNSIKWLETLSAPVLIAIGLALLGWGVVAGGGLGRVLDHSRNFSRPAVRAERAEEAGKFRLHLSPVEIDGQPRAGRFRFAFDASALTTAPWQPIGGADPGPGRGYGIFRTESMPPGATTVYVEFESAGHSGAASAAIAPSGAAAGGFWAMFFPLLTAMVGYWATLALNIPDFTRFARSQKDQLLGQLMGLPTTMGLYAFIGIATTCASLLAFPDILVAEQAPWDPVALLSRFDSPALVIVSMIFLMIATLTTNLAANVVSPANDLANLAPKYINFRVGGLITAVIGIVMMPWKLVERPDAYIFGWLIGYGALLGPIAGVMIADYYVVRRRELALADLYRSTGRYGAFNPVSIAILFAAILPNVPGFLHSVGALQAGPFWQGLFTYAWFVGFAIAFCLQALAGTLRNRSQGDAHAWKPIGTS